MGDSTAIWFSQSLRSGEISRLTWPSIREREEQAALRRFRRARGDCGASDHVECGAAPEGIRYAHRVEIYALAKLGALLKDVEKNVGGERE